MSSPIRRRRRVLPTRPGAVGSREWAEAIASATIGAPRYLLGLDGLLYWSSLPENHDDEAGPCGAETYPDPMKALAALTKNVGMIRCPVGFEVVDDGGDPATTGEFGPAVPAHAEVALQGNGSDPVAAVAS